MRNASTSKLESWRRAHLQFNQRQCDTESIELQGDALIVTSSWEKRCHHISKAVLSGYAFATMIGFEERGVSGRRAEHDAVLGDLVAQKSDKSVSMTSYSIRNSQAWRDAIFEFLAQARMKVGRPIDLVIDTTCLPKYYSLAIIAYAIQSGVARSVKMFYAQGIYAPEGANTSLDPDHAFTSGEWRSLPIPFLEGDLMPDKKIEIVASLGFETFQARKMIGLYEAECHSLIIPYPGFTEQYGERSLQEVTALANFLELPDNAVSRCAAGDSISVARNVVKILEEGGRYKSVALCLGPKSHAIGLAVAGLLFPQLTVVSRFPDEYVETETPASGVSCVYDLVDLSAPSPNQSP